MKRAVPAGRQGFTLVELLVAITIFLVLVVGSLIYINNFNSRQKLASVRQEIVSYIRMARDYAISLQNPDGGNLDYVKVELEEGMLKAWPNGVGSTYFAKDVTPAGVGVSMAPTPLLFSAYEGKVVELSGGQLAPVDEKTTITVTLGGEVEASTTIEVSASGLIN
jgi:prepilin-type N-terminal cleavage/methylation domain-containing protein